MPAQRAEKQISDDGNVKTMQLEVGQPDKTVKLATYTIPSTAGKFQEFVLAASDKAAKDGDESPLDNAYRMYVQGVIKQTRQDAYEAAQQESTYFRVAGERVNILTFPVKNIIRAHNGYVAQVDVRAMVGGDTPEARLQAEDAVGYGPWKVAARKLIEGGYATQGDGGVLTLVADKDGDAKLA